MVSHCVGTRFIQLIGGVMTSFYDWYADLPVASPQVFGDQTDVPESGDWWDATYLMMWGSNVPVTRTPDAHWMAEVRYRGTKVVTVSPDYADNTKFADEWMPAQAGTDAALAMAMGHVLLKEFFVDREVAVLHRLRAHLHRPAVPHPPRAAQEAYAAAPGDAGLRARASSSPPPTSPTGRATPRRGRLEDRRCSTRRPVQPVVPNGSMGFRYAESGEGRWNLDLEGVDPGAVVRRRPTAEPVEVLLPAFVEPDGTGVGAAPRRARPPRSAATWSPPSST